MWTIWYSYHFIVFREGCLMFKIRLGTWPFWNLDYVLSPEGTLQSRAQWGPFWFFPFYCAMRRVFDTFNLQTEICQKKTWKCFIYGWMGWDGWDGMDGMDAGQASWVSPDLFVKTSLTSFVIALFSTTVVIYVTNCYEYMNKAMSLSSCY